MMGLSGNRLSVTTIPVLVASAAHLKMKSGRGGLIVTPQWNEVFL